MEPTEPIVVRERRIIRISRRKFIGVIVVLLAIVGLFGWSQMRHYGYNGYGANQLSTREIPMVPSVTPSSIPQPYDYNWNYPVDITDTREFLKISYRGNIKTRDVQDKIGDVKNAIRDVEGRIDSSSVSEKSGYISFVVPKSKYESFKAEVESLVHTKLYTEHESTQNLVGQKQNLEKQTNSATTSLAALEKNKKDLDAAHAKILASLNIELMNVSNALANIREQKADVLNTPGDELPDEERLAQLQNQETALMQNETNIRQRQTIENQSYTSQSKTLALQIEQAGGKVDNLKQQDTQFTNNVETVNGYVEVRWISLWGLAVIFSPIHPIILIIILALIFFFYSKRKGYVPRVEFV